MKHERDYNSGLVRWLRPGYQAPTEQRRRAGQAALDVDEAASLLPWPKRTAAQFVALRAALSRDAPADLAGRFRGAKPGTVAAMLDTLAALGQARQAGAGRWMA